MHMTCGTALLRDNKNVEQTLAHTHTPAHTHTHTHIHTHTHTHTHRGVGNTLNLATLIAASFGFPRSKASQGQRNKCFETAPLTKVLLFVIQFMSRRTCGTGILHFKGRTSGKLYLRRLHWHFFANIMPPKCRVSGAMFCNVFCPLLHLWVPPSKTCRRQAIYLNRLYDHS